METPTVIQVEVASADCTARHLDNDIARVDDPRLGHFDCRTCQLS